jgi:hypothetical protein
MTLKTALEVARGTTLSIHEMGYACGVEDMRHRALDALLAAWESIHLMANSDLTFSAVSAMMDSMEKK